MTLKIDREEEARRLEEIAANSLYAVGANGLSVRWCTRLFARHWRGDSCLELGPAEGEMTGALVEHFDKVTAVEGSELFAKGIAERHPEVTVHNSLFEDFDTDERFDAVVIGHVLEHVDDPVWLLSRARDWLKDDGRVYAAVPNARSLHRQAAVIMGLLPHEHAFSDQDRHNGHRRVYNPETLRADVIAAGLKVEVFGGYWLKPLSNAQIEASWSEELIDAYMALGERYPDIAAEIYVIASK